MGFIDAKVSLNFSNTDEMLKKMVELGRPTPENTTVLLNGKAVAFTQDMSGHDGTSAEYSLRFNAGNPGEDELKVSIGGITGGTNFKYMPHGKIEVLDTADNEAFFDIKDIEWAGYYIDPGTLKITLNGKEVHCALNKDTGFEGLIKGIMSVGTEGKQELDIKCVDYAGTTLEAARTFYNFVKHDVEPGTVFLYRVAPNGSRSGPFYRVTSINDRLAVGNDTVPADVCRLLDGKLFCRNF